MTRNAVVIDDDPDFRDILTRILGPEFHVSSSGDGEGGLRLCASGAPDLVLLDMCLPGLSGLGVLSRLAADPKTAAVPVLAFSAGRVEGPLRDALRARGVVRVLDKLDHPREFLAAARTLTGGGQ
ncbi:response regulator [bacterium]|nr:MAG: response regulator [bacterium]